MSYEFRLQDPGEGIHEAEIREILVSEGSHVEEGDNVLVAETDKAAVEIPAPVTGTVSGVEIEQGQIVNVGDVLIVINDEEGDGNEDEDEDKDRTEPREGAARREQEVGSDKQGEQGKAVKDAASRDEASGEDSARGKRGPSGNGPGSRSRAGSRGGEPIPAAPAARRVARELNVDLEQVEGSGDNGRVLKEDVRLAAGAGGAAAKEHARPESRVPDFEKWGEVERVPLRSFRRAAARRMTRAWTEIPHAMHQDEIDITELEFLRREHGDEVEQRGGKLTLTPFFIKAVVAALKEYPRFNASLDADAEEIVIKHYYHIGIALDSDRGLVVPVIRDADRKSVAELAVEMKEIGDSVRGGNASQDRLRGGTFTLTNVGALGGTQMAPIINFPEAAIFGTARARMRPVAYGDLEDHRIEPRLILPVVLAFDHRINDGADAARFISSIKAVLSNPDELVLMG